MYLDTTSIPCLPHHFHSSNKRQAGERDETTGPKTGVREMEKRDQARHLTKEEEEQQVDGQHDEQKKTRQVKCKS
jgi:hypothetical protein